MSGTSTAAKVFRVIGKITGRFFALLGVILLAAVIMLVGVSYIFCKGPSPLASDLFVVTMMETSALKFVPAMFFSDAEIKAIQARNSTVETLEVTDESLIVIPTAEEIASDSEREPLEIIDIAASSYKG